MAVIIKHDTSSGVYPHSLNFFLKPPSWFHLLSTPFVDNWNNPTDAQLRRALQPIRRWQPSTAGTANYTSASDQRSRPDHRHSDRQSDPACHQHPGNHAVTNQARTAGNMILRCANTYIGSEQLIFQLSTTIQSSEPWKQTWVCSPFSPHLHSFLSFMHTRFEFILKCKNWGNKINFRTRMVHRHGQPSENIIDLKMTLSVLKLRGKPWHYSADGWTLGRWTPNCGSPKTADHTLDWIDAFAVMFMLFVCSSKPACTRPSTGIIYGCQTLPSRIFPVKLDNSPSLSTVLTVCA